MIRRLVSGAVSFVVGCVLLYFFFFVPIGQRTLYEHASRIASTDEAQDLGDDVAAARDRLEKRVREEIAP